MESDINFPQNMEICAYILDKVIQDKKCSHIFFYKHIKIQGLGSHMLKAAQNMYRINACDIISFL